MRITILLIILSVTVSLAQSPKRDSIWAPVNFFVGEWHGGIRGHTLTIDNN